MKRNYTKFVLSVLCLSSMGVGALMVFSQTKESENDKERMLRIIKRDAMFSKLSSTIPETDDGFSIVAVRRIDVWMNHPIDYDPAARTKKELVQVELSLIFEPPARNFGDNYVQIGDKIFLSTVEFCEKPKCISAVMSPKEFESLKDNALITLHNFRFAADRLLEKYKDGEPKEVYGVKFGRINKKIIYDFPKIEINAPR